MLHGLPFGSYDGLDQDERTCSMSRASNGSWLKPRTVLKGTPNGLSGAEKMLV